MKRTWFLALAALMVALGSARAADAPAKDDEGKHGTSVAFVDNPSEAARLAKKQEKLVFVLHISGIFEDPGCT
jgi:hypothetical protein